MSPRASGLAVSAEFAYFGIQAFAYGVLVQALSNPGSLLSSQSVAVAAAVLTLGLGVLLAIGEGLKYAAQSAKYRLAYDYEVEVLQRVLRYGHRANRFDKQTIKDVVSRSPQLSARVAMAAVDGVVPTFVGLIAGAVVTVRYPLFAVWLAIGLTITAPLYLVVIRRGRSATQQFYSPEGLNYARDAVLFFSPGRGGLGVNGASQILRASQRSLKALELRRSTPNLTYLVTGVAMSITLAGLVGYSVIIASRVENPSADLLQIFFVLRFLYSGVGGLSGAISKSHILLPRVEPVMWALRQEPPPRTVDLTALILQDDGLEDFIDEQ